MPGLGSAPLGSLPCGAPSVQSHSAAPGVASPRAIKFDLATRSFPMNADGTLVDVHPVDQTVELALGIELGKIPSASTVGQRIRAAANRLAGTKLVATVTDAINAALAAPLANNDIATLGVAIDTSVRGRIVVAYQYVNLRSGSEQTKTFTAAVGAK